MKTKFQCVGCCEWFTNDEYANHKCKERINFL